jgi:uncharacterized protein YeaO (DUF488 family)
MPDIRLRRIYDEPGPDDGFRVLADRLWPRGMTKEGAAIDHWAKALAPSTELRRKYHADGDFDTFRGQYLVELADSPADERELVGSREVVTLLTASKDLDRSALPVLREFLQA